MSKGPVSVLMVAPGVPYPPNRGGKADIWRRAVALRKCGASVLLVCPRADEVTSKLAEAAAAEVGVELIQYSRAPAIAGVVAWIKSFASIPLFTARRLPDEDTREQLAAHARTAAVDVVVSEGPWLWPLAKSISVKIGCPLVYRSHNVEWAYMRRQRELERSVKARAAMFVSFLSLKRFEQQAVASSNVLLDISADDLATWRHPHAHCLPPIPAPRLAPGLAERTSGILFLGNLMSPNNLAGLKFLLEEVLPAVRRQVPELKCNVVGSGPSVQTERWIAASGATLHKDVADPMAWAAGSDCIVNPVQDGSGVQLKTLDMLQTDRPIVTFDQGLRGLPSLVRSSVRVVKNGDEMVTAILELHKQGFPAVAERDAVRKLFDDQAFFKALCEASK